MDKDNKISESERRNPPSVLCGGEESSESVKRGGASDKLVEEFVGDKLKRDSGNG